MKWSVLLVFLLTGCLTAPDTSPNTLTPAHFQTTASIRNDPLDGVEVITTKPGFSDKRRDYQSEGLLTQGQYTSTDKYLVARIDKKTGKTQYQLFQHVLYTGLREGFVGAQYETAGASVSAKINSVRKERVTCRGVPDGQCIQIEEFFFEIDSGTLRWMASQYILGENRTWRYKLTTKGLDERQEQLLFAEAAGLLGAVEAYKKDRGLQ